MKALCVCTLTALLTVSFGRSAPAAKTDTLRADLAAIHRGPDHARRIETIGTWLDSQITWARTRHNPEDMLVGSRKGQTPKIYSPLLTQAVITALLQSKRPEDVQLAKQILASALEKMQVADPKDPRFGQYGNLDKGKIVGGGISQAFVMTHYTWMYMKQREAMGPELTEELRKSLLRGLAWQMRHDNILWYSNSEMQNMASLLVAADLLGHAEGSRKGRELFDRWCRWQLRIGLVNEYNCPEYGQPQFSSLGLIAAGAKDSATALRAMFMFERLLLQHCAFFYPPIQRAAGPNKRRYGGVLYDNAYTNYILGREVPGIRFEHAIKSNACRTTIEDYHVPDYLQTILMRKAYPYTIAARTELKDDFAGDAVCHMTPDFAMGAAGRGRTLHWGNIGNHLSVFYPRAAGKDGRLGWGVAGLRFHSGGGPHSETQRWWLDKGNTLCLQDGPVAIGLTRACEFDSVKLWAKHRNLTPEQRREQKIVAYPGVTYLGTDVVFLSDGAKFEADLAVWVDGKPVRRFPFESDTAGVVVVRDHKTLVGIAPVHVPDLGRDKALVIRRAEYMKHPAMLVRFPMYRGPAKDFLCEEIEPVAGVVAMEAASARKPGAVDSFLKRMADGKADSTGTRGKQMTYTYSSGGKALKAVYDFPSNTWAERFVDGKRFEAPVWVSNDARHSDSGSIRLRDTVLRTKEGLPVWMIAVEKPTQLVVYNATTQTTPIDLMHAFGRLRMKAFGMGKIVCRRTDTGWKIEFVALVRPTGTIESDGKTTITWNGRAIPVEKGRF